MAGKKDRGKTKDELIAELGGLRLRIASLEQSENAIKQAGFVAGAELKLFRNLIDQVNDAIFVINPETGCFLDVNARACSNLGYGLEELRKMCVWDIETRIPDIFSWKARVNEVRNEGNAVREGRQRRKDGSAFPVEINASYISLEENDYFVAVVRDISERKEAEEELRDALRRGKDERIRSEAIIAAIGDGITIQDRDFRILYQNQLLTNMIGNHVGEYCYMVYEGMERTCEGCAVAMSFRDGGIHTVERAVPTAKGLMHLEITSSALKDSEGKIIAGIEVVRDVTERKRVEESLKEQKIFAESLIENSAVAAFVLNPQHDVVFWNKACEELTGTSASQMIGTQDQWKPFYARKRQVLADIIIDSNFGDLPALYSAYAQPALLKNGLHSGGWYPNLNGRDRYIIFDAAPVYDTGGKLTFVIETLQDITERKKVEDELTLFRNLVNQANDELFVIDPETGRYLDVNVRACKNLGYAREELLAKAVSDIDDVVVPDPFTWKAHVDEVRNKGHVVVEGRHIRKDGTTYPVEVNVTHISVEKREYMVAVVRDITERKKAGEELRRIEKKYRDLFDTTLDGIYQIDADGVFVLMNPAGARIFGYESPDEIIGRRGLEYWRDPGDRDAFRAELRIKKSVSGYHLRLKKKNGEPVDLETSSTIIEDEKGHFLGMEGILRDITERKKLEDQLRQAQKMEAVGQLAGGIAHDFNNILSAIIGYGHLLHMKMDSNDPLRINVEQILEAGDRAASLTQNLLAFSRKQIMNARPVSLNEIMMKVEKFLLRIIGEDIELKASFCDEVLTVNVDVGQIEQAVMNLATNARDAMPRGGSLSIETGLTVMDDEFIKAYGFGESGKYALISMTDTGTGMDRETRDKIFEPFFTTKEVGKGTGLGLAMVYGIVKQHDGFITVYSEPGQGTTFRIYIPAVTVRVEEEKEATLPAIPAGGRETILVAEDDPALRKLDMIVLREFGYDVITAEDGEEAIHRFMENSDRINLCLLDVIMPKLSGKEVFERIREMRPGIKVLFASGYAADKTHMEKLLQEGLDYMQKPLSPRDLLTKIREILDREATEETSTIFFEI